MINVSNIAISPLKVKGRILMPIYPTREEMDIKLGKAINRALVEAVQKNGFSNEDVIFTEIKSTCMEHGFNESVADTRATAACSLLHSFMDSGFFTIDENTLNVKLSTALVDNYIAFDVSSEVKVPMRKALEQALQGAHDRSWTAADVALHIMRSFNDVNVTLNNYTTQRGISFDTALIEFQTPTGGQSISKYVEYNGTPQDLIENVIESAEAYNASAEFEAFKNANPEYAESKLADIVKKDCEHAETYFKRMANTLRNLSRDMQLRSHPGDTNLDHISEER